MSTPPSAQPPLQNKPRRKRSADVVSFEDLLAAHKTERGPGQLPAEGVVLIGVDLELQRRMAEGIGRTEPPAAEPNFSAPINDAPILSSSTSAVHAHSGAPAISAPNFSAPPINEPAASRKSPKTEVRDRGGTAPEKSALNIGAPNFSAPPFDVRDLLIRRSGSKTYTVHPVSRIEDVFTSAERDLLRWLWERGRPVPATQRIRLVTGANGEGARRLAAQAGLIYNTFKNLSRSLAAKFALDIVKPEKNLPAIYAVHHYSAILERQREAGYTGVVHKNGGGRELVDAFAQSAPRRPDLTVEELERMISAPNFGALKNDIGAPKFEAGLANFGAPKIGAPIRNKEYTSEKELTTTSSKGVPNFSAPSIVVHALFERTGRTDAEAARMITKGCLEADPSIQPEEIARLIETAQIPPSIANPVGLLIRALPSRCAPESLSKYREHWRKEEAEKKRRREEEREQMIETARGILDGAGKGEEWDAGTIEWAKGILAGEQEEATA